MSFNIWHLIGLLWLPLVVLSEGMDLSDINKCTQLLDTQKLAHCCGKGFLDKFIFVGSNCTPYWDDYGPCRFECLYKHWDLFDGDKKIKKAQFYTMVTELYSPLNGHHNYGTAMKTAHETCEQLGTKHADFVMLYAYKVDSRLGLATSKCQPHAMIHAQCLMVHVTLHCPKEEFRSTENCRDLQKVISSCAVKLNLERVENKDLMMSDKGAGDGWLISGELWLVLMVPLSLILCHL
ncbi:Odorant-binding protein 50b [Drosophila ananassae]|uniref:Odorant-binding protein 50b n=1 Tax=Drosophila ananassae TaxID=7217 RepID=B3ME02_DROAN|nr:uncharacterized protein LOC6496339 [Drosophila ananassae]EDV37547.1 Odorant-binding protein 50b [Drosophila ananassae]